MIDERIVTAWHEAGHGLVCGLEFGNVASLTIKPEGRALGQQFVERFAHNRPEVIASILAGAGDESLAQLMRRRALGGVRWCLAGRMAESVLAGRMLPLLEDDDVLEAVAYCDVAGANGDRWMRVLVLESERLRVRRWLGRHRAHLEAVASRLLDRETIDGDEMWSALEGLPRMSYPRAWTRGG